MAAALLGASDVAKLLGVSRQRVYELLDTHEDFPRPVASLARGAVWDRGQVEAWVATWKRRPGRPAKAEGQTEDGEGRNPQTGRPLRRRSASRT
jgi:predicted DNA-binding transcriptional regulator AlpA